MFKLLRFYSAASFVLIFLAASLLALFYRQTTLPWIEHLAKGNNLAVARTALNSVEPELAAYLAAGAHKLPAGLDARLHRITRDTATSSIDIYDRRGLPIFSTHADAPARARDPGLLAALDGRVSGSMIFRDGVAGGADHPMRTYTPIRGSPSGPVLGVFETHTDMSHLVEESEGILLSVLVGAEFILALLYAMLFLVVRHARNVIAAQQETIRERTASLEILSQGLLNGEETSRKKIAYDLHEGLAQTLSAIKVHVEYGTLLNKGAQPLESLVPVLQEAIHEVRTIATELRPSSLDELGLLPTIDWYCREFERLHPEIRILRDISLPEDRIPAQLKIVIYRIVESAFRNIAKYSSTDSIRFALHLAEDMIHLVIGDTPSEQPAVATLARFAPDSSPQLRFAEIRERTSLSGGEFSARTKKSGWVTLHSSWACAS
jgi:signal transduction histidine kinase